MLNLDKQKSTKTNTLITFLLTHYLFNCFNKNDVLNYFNDTNDYHFLTQITL
jgi:hypothetical protein